MLNSKQDLRYAVALYVQEVNMCASDS